MIIPKRAIIIKSRAQWKRLRTQVYVRDDYTCQIKECLCREPLTEDQLQPHHIIPKGRMRLDVIWNLLTICNHCHYLLTNGLLPETTIQSIIVDHGLEGWNKINGTT